MMAQWSDAHRSTSRNAGGRHARSGGLRIGCRRRPGAPPLPALRRRPTACSQLPRIRRATTRRRHRQPAKHHLPPTNRPPGRRTTPTDPANHHRRTSRQPNQHREPVPSLPRSMTRRRRRGPTTGARPTTHRHPLRPPTGRHRSIEVRAESADSPLPDLAVRRDQLQRRLGQPAQRTAQRPAPVGVVLGAALTIVPSGSPRGRAVRSRARRSGQGDRVGHPGQRRPGG